MKVEFAFDEKALKEDGKSLERVVSTLKSNFAKFNLPCVEDGEIIAFKSTGDKRDFARMWNLIIAYAKTDWFFKYATKCNFYKYDDKTYENVLEEAKEPIIQERLARLRA